MTPIGPWLTVKQAAARLQVSTQTIYRIKGELCAKRIGRAIRFHIDYLDAYGAQGPKESSAPHSISRFQAARDRVRSLTIHRTDAQSADTLPRERTG